MLDLIRFNLACNDLYGNFINQFYGLVWTYDGDTLLELAEDLGNPIQAEEVASGALRLRNLHPIGNEGVLDLRYTHRKRHVGNCYWDEFVVRPSQACRLLDYLRHCRWIWIAGDDELAEQWQEGLGLRPDLLEAAVLRGRADD